MGRHVALITLSAALLLHVRPVQATGVDGQLDPDYGAPITIQTTQTGLGAGQIVGDNNKGDLNFSNGSELDGGYGFVSGGVLYLFLGGNLALMTRMNQVDTIGHTLDVFIDSVPGGQNSLNGLGSGNPLNSLTFDAGFTADYRLELSGGLSGGANSPPIWAAGYQMMTSTGGGPFVNLGFGSAGGPGTLSGGSNPHGILATLDNRNIAGVTFGCAAASGAGVTTGIEWAIPLAAIGNPTGCITLAVIVRESGATGSVSNQVLGPVPAGTCPPGPAATVNFQNIAGNQFFTVCRGIIGVPRSTGTKMAFVGVHPNPGRGDQLRVAFELPGSKPALLQVVDCAGRVIREQRVDPPSGGFGTANLANGRRLPGGVYWVRLSQGQSFVARSFCIVN